MEDGQREQKGQWASSAIGRFSEKRVDRRSERRLMDRGFVGYDGQGQKMGRGDRTHFGQFRFFPCISYLPTAITFEFFINKLFSSRRFKKKRENSIVLGSTLKEWTSIINRLGRVKAKQKWSLATHTNEFVVYF